MERTCPTCQAILPDGIASCPHCQAPVPPPIATPVAPPPSFATPVPPRPQMPAGVVIKPKVNYRDLARWQRCLLWIVLAQVLSYLVQYSALLPPTPGVHLSLVFGRMGLSLIMIVIAVLVMVAERSHVAVIVLTAMLMIPPCVGLLIVLLINHSATRTLRKAGIRVGSMGARADDVERITNPALCTFCGYNLTGNVSGFCPECGCAMM